MELLAILLFFSIFLLILYGYPVALTLGGISVIYALCFLEPVTFNALPSRIMGTMTNYVLLAVPLFIFMGIMLEKSKLAENMLETMSMLFGKMRGGLAISVIIVGALLAASTGIVGATVVTMGLISLPTMLKRGYNTELATGVIASSGTLGQIIPPSVVLVLLGSVLNVSVGDLFKAAMLPGALLVLIYVLYVLVAARLNPAAAPAIPPAEIRAFRADKYFVRRVIGAFVLPFVLILSVLGSIFAGIATPTEAAAVGAAGATILTFFAPKFIPPAAGADNRFSLSMLRSVTEETTHLTCMVFLILLGATTFTFVFRSMGGDTFLTDLINNSGLSPAMFLLLVMVVVFIAGFFIDFIEIIFIVVPVVAPIFVELEMNLLWIGILLALNLQTSFLSPPFGFSLFYLKGVAPPSVTTGHLYRGIIPFVVIQLIFLAVVAFFPETVLFMVD